MGRILKSKKNKQNTIPKNNSIPIPQMTEDAEFTKLRAFTITNGATGECRILNIEIDSHDELPPGHYNDIWNDGDW